MQLQHSCYKVALIQVHWMKCVHPSSLQKKYRQQPDSLRFTSVTDSPDIVHAKTSYQQCSEVRGKKKKTWNSQSIYYHLSKTLPGSRGCVAPDDLPAFALQRLYKSGQNDDMHRYTLHPDDPDFVRAKVNAQQISDVGQLLLSKIHLQMYRKNTWNHFWIVSPEESLQSVRGASPDSRLWSEVGCYSLPDC